MTETSEMSPDIAGRLAAAVKKHSEDILVWLLCLISVSAVTYIYVESVVNGYIVFTAAAAACYIRLFNILRTKKLGGFVYFGIMTAVVILCSFIAGADIESAYNFVRWFFSGAQSEETRVSFMLSVVVFMSFFFTSAAYYFIKIIYRSSMVALLSLIPFALAAKASMSLPAAYYMVSASVNLIAFICDGRKNLFKGRISGGGSAGVVYTDFILAAILLALLIPKPEQTPFYEKFEEFSNRFSFGGSGETEYRGEYKTESGNADDLVRGDSKLIYILQASEAEYMKVQVFDLYDHERNRWKPLNDTITGERDWTEAASLLNYKKLETAIGEAGNADPEFYEKHPFAERLSPADDPTVYSMVYTREYESQYMISPVRTFSAEVSGAADSYPCARSFTGEMFSNKVMPRNAVYSLRSYSGNVAEQLIADGFCDISFEEYKDMLGDAYELSRKGSENRKVIRAFMDELARAEEYRKNTRTEVSDEVKALAEELTSGLEYDHEKARAIEEFFRSGRFIYDLSYTPPADSNTVEYFIFESRTGICGDFATAFTVLARAAGLTVRYTEGFIPQRDAESQNMMMYYILTDNAHAYPEVYIPGAGWVVYEPTAPNLLGRDGDNDQAGGAMSRAELLLTIVVYIIGFGLFIVFILVRPAIAERFFRIRVRHTDRKKAVVMLYNRHIRNAERRMGISMKAYTPEQAAGAAEEFTGISLMPLTKPFTAVCYGGEDIDKKDLAEAYDCYKEQAKALKKRKRRGRK